MGKAKQRHGNKPRQAKINAAEPEFKLLRNMSPTNKYAGAARMIELAPPGIQFRALTNVDHIIQISFANKVEDIKVYDEEHVDGKKTLIETDDQGNEVQQLVEALFHMENRVTGFVVTVVVGGQQNEFTFSKLEVGIAYYNGLIEQLDAIGIPMALKERIFVPPPPPEVTIPELLGPDGEPLPTADEIIDSDLDDLEPEEAPEKTH